MARRRWCTRCVSARRWRRRSRSDLLFGASIYRLLGGSGETLEHALAYSNIVFAGAITVWLANTLSSVLRGTGNMLAPALTLIAAALVHLPLSGALVLGLGPLPRLGIAGAGVAYVTTFGIAGLAMALVVLRPGSALRPRAEDLALEWPLFREILRVGALSVASAVQTVLTAIVVTGFVGRYGIAALAGYGVGLRLERFKSRSSLPWGQALVVLVGTNLAGRARAPSASLDRAALGRRSALHRLDLALFPLPGGPVSDDPAVLESVSRYLRTVAPFIRSSRRHQLYSPRGPARVLAGSAGTVSLLAVIAGASSPRAQGVFASTRRLGYRPLTMCRCRAR